MPLTDEARFSNEYARRFADALESARLDAEYVVAAYDALALPEADGAEILADGAPEDGRATITRGQMLAVVQAARGLVAWAESGPRVAAQAVQVNAASRFAEPPE